MPIDIAKVSSIFLAAVENTKPVSRDDCPFLCHRSNYVQVVPIGMAA